MATENTRVLVSHLRYTTSNCGVLRALCKSAIEDNGDVVDVYVPRDENSTLALGHGFVTFSSAKAAELAVSRLNGRLFQGLNLLAKVVDPHTGEINNLGLGDKPFEIGASANKIIFQDVEMSNEDGVSLFVKVAAEVPVRIVEKVGKWGTKDFRYKIEYSVFSSDGENDSVLEEEVHPQVLFYLKSPSPRRRKQNHRDNYDRRR